MGKAKRRKQQARLDKEHGASVQPEAKKSSFSGHLRNNVAAYALMAATAIGLGTCESSHLLRRSPKIEVDMKFLLHDAKLGQDQKLLEEISDAAAKGNPYSLLLVEAAGESEKDYVKLTGSINSTLADVKTRYDSLLPQMGQAEAESESVEYLKSLQPKLDDFAAKTYTGAAIRGLKVAYLEAYSDKDTSQLFSFNDYDTQFYSNWNYAVNNGNPTLGQLMSMRMEFEKNFAQMETMRDEKTAEGLESRIKELVKLYPDLETDSGKVRVIAYMGAGHIKDYNEFVKDNRDVKFTEELYDCSFSLYATLGLSIDKWRPLDKRESYIAALAQSKPGLYIETVIAKENPDLARLFVSNAMAMTESQYEQLDSASSNIKDVGERDAFIENTVTQTKLFRP
jgi:hypothetical protein